jgi:hypothetical protein
VHKTGDAAAINALEHALGISAVAKKVVPRHCDKAAAGKALRALECDAVLTLACGLGVQALAESTSMPVYPASDTLWIGENDRRYCAACGRCVLHKTAGICPYRCPKGLLNGPCGGLKERSCELGGECAWLLIYERKKERGELAELNEVIE